MMTTLASLKYNYLQKQQAQEQSTCTTTTNTTKENHHQNNKQPYAHFVIQIDPTDTQKNSAKQ